MIYLSAGSNIFYLYQCIEMIVIVFSLYLMLEHNEQSYIKLVKCTTKLKICFRCKEFIYKSIPFDEDIDSDVNDKNGVQNNVEMVSSDTTLRTDEVNTNNKDNMTSSGKVTYTITPQDIETDCK